MTRSQLVLGALMLGLYLPHGYGDEAEESDYKTELQPKLAAFYTIDSGGRSVRDNPTVAAISSPNAGATRPLARRIIAPEQRSPPDVVSISIRHHAATRCERHGLFYTRDGRCVQPEPNRLRLAHPGVTTTSATVRSAVPFRREPTIR
jgi:hypothetical protein